MVLFGEEPKRFSQDTTSGSETEWFKLNDGFCSIVNSPTHENNMADRRFSLPPQQNGNVWTFPVFDFRGKSRTWSGSLTGPASVGSPRPAPTDNLLAKSFDAWPRQNWVTTLRLASLLPPGASFVPKRAISMPLDFLASPRSGSSSEKTGHADRNISNSSLKASISESHQMQLRIPSPRMNQNWSPSGFLLTLEDFLDSGSPQSCNAECFQSSPLKERNKKSGEKLHHKQPGLTAKQNSFDGVLCSSGKPPLSGEMRRSSENTPDRGSPRGEESFNLRQWNELLKEAKGHSNVESNDGKCKVERGKSRLAEESKFQLRQNLETYAESKLLHKALSLPMQDFSVKKGEISIPTSFETTKKSRGKWKYVSSPEKQKTIDIVVSKAKVPSGDYEHKSPQKNSSDWWTDFMLSRPA